MSAPEYTARQVLAGILHGTRTAEQAARLLDGHAAEVLATDADRTRTQQQRARAAQNRVLGDITSELALQDAVFGKPEYPDDLALTDDYRKAQDLYAKVHRLNSNLSKRTWIGLLMQAAYAVGSEPVPDRRRMYLVQVAATAVAWIEAIDRRTQPAPTAPGRPSPLMLRELVQAARDQTPPATATAGSALCGDRAELPEGGAVTCSKLGGHPGPWHRRGLHSWKLVFGVPNGRATPESRTSPEARAARELGRLRVLAPTLRTALKRISTQDCACAAIAGEVLARADQRT